MQARTALAAQQDAEVSPEAAVEIREVKPDRGEAGREVAVAIDGRNFARGVYVSFSHPAVRVLSTRRVSDTRLEVRLAIGAQAPGGSLSLFVSNTAGPVAEAPFTIAGGATPVTPKKESIPATAAGPVASGATTETPEAASTPPAAAPAPAVTTPTTETLRFEVFNLGEGVSILQDLNKPRGTLTFSDGKLRYEEAGKEVFAAPPAEIKEIDANLIFGVSTGTFHVILASGKTFNFVPASLKPAESQSIIEALRQVLK